MQVCRARRKLSHRTAEAITWNGRFLAIPGPRQQERKDGSRMLITNAERGIGSAASQKRGHFCRDVRPGEVSAGVIGGQLAAQAGFPILVSCKRNHFRKAGTAHLWVWTESARFKTDAPTIRNDTEAFKCLCGSGLPPSGLFLRPLRRFFVSSCTLNGCDAGTSNLD